MSQPRGNTTDRPFRFDGGETECFTAPEAKNNSTSVFLDLRGSNFQGSIKVSVIGVRDGSDSNCTNRGEYFNVCANRKYMLFNSVNEDRKPYAKLRFIKNPGDIVCGVWSPDSIPDNQCEILRAGESGGSSGSDNSPNTKDECFSFTGSSFDTNYRRKGNKTSIYLNLCESSFPGSIQVSIYGRGNGQEKNCTNRCEYFNVEAGKKYFLYNSVLEDNFHEARLSFRCNGDKTVRGKWSPDSIGEPGCVTLTGQSGNGQSSQAPPIQRAPASSARKLIKVPYLNQNDIASGCESVSAVMVLKYYGYNITARQFVDSHLNKKPWHESNGVIYGPDPNSAFPGDPYVSSGRNCGYGCYAPCIANAMNKITGSSRQAFEKTGKSLEDLCHTFVDADMPVLVWATINMVPSEPGVRWKIDYTDANSKYQNGSTFQWIKHEHCLVLVGYNDNNYFFNDPYKNNGVVGYPKNIVESRFRELGSQSVVLITVHQPKPNPGKSSEEIAREKAEEIAPSILGCFCGIKETQKFQKITFSSGLIEGYFECKGVFSYQKDAKSNISIEGGKITMDGVFDNIPFVGGSSISIGGEKLSTKIKLPNGSSFGFDFPQNPSFQKAVEMKLTIISQTIGDGKIDVKLEDGDIKFEISKKIVVGNNEYEAKYILAFHFKPPNPAVVISQAFCFMNQCAAQFRRSAVQFGISVIIVDLIIIIAYLLTIVIGGGLTVLALA